MIRGRNIKTERNHETLTSRRTATGRDELKSLTNKVNFQKVVGSDQRKILKLSKKTGQIKKKYLLSLKRKDPKY